MDPSALPLAGRLDQHVLTSRALTGNPLGDPHERPLWVQLPAGYDESAEPLPVVYVIQGYTGRIEMWANRAPFKPTYLETADRVLSEGPPVIVVYVDAWTSYGGSQYVDSVGTGDYLSYLCDDVVSFVDERYRTIPAAGSRAVQGKSSGGYGAMTVPLRRPDVFGALATHAGDSLYELCYQREFGAAVRALRSYGGDVSAWWADFTSRPPFSKPADMVLLELYGCSACYSPAAGGTPQLPFDTRTGEPIAENWERWLANDPVRLVQERAEVVPGLRAVWIDAGSSDDYFLDLGAEVFRDRVVAAGLPQDRLHFELFEGTHAGIDHRYPLSLAWLAQRLER